MADGPQRLDKIRIDDLRLACVIGILPEERLRAQSVILNFEATLTKQFAADKKYAFEERNGKMMRQYSSGFTIAYNQMLGGMVERRMRLSIESVASFWYTAWVNAGQPDLKTLRNATFSEEDLKEFQSLNNAWKKNPSKGREHE